MERIAENTVIIDGQEYKPGDVIPDFKSIKCVDTREPRKYQGLSADVSVLNDVIAKYASGGASCFMLDTGEYYEYDREENTWKLITNITERGFDSEKSYGVLKHMLKNFSVSDEKIQSAVTDYLTVNPVLPGATTEQAQQIEQNKTDVASLKEETNSLKEDLDSVTYVRNLWDEQWEIGGLDDFTGRNDDSVTSTIRSKNLCEVNGGETIYVVYPIANNMRMLFYDKNRNYIANSFVWVGGAKFTVPSAAKYFRFRTVKAYGTVYKNDICINLSDDYDGKYSPHRTSAIDNELRESVNKISETVENNSEILTDLKKNKVYSDNAIYRKESVEIINTGGQYLRDEICTLTDFKVGDIFCFSVDTVIGSGVPNPIAIICEGIDGGNYKYIQETKRASIIITDDVAKNTQKLKFILYPITIDGDKAIFRNIVITNNRIGGYKTSAQFKELMYTENRLLPSNTVKSVSHRGRYGRGLGTMCGESAVISAKRYGYDTVENDVAVTKDGELVMFHDSTLYLIGDSAHSINDYTLSELKAKDFGSVWGFPNEKILTFEEWILLCKKLGLNCYIDFKVVNDDFTIQMAETMVGIIRKYGMLNHVSYLNNHEKIRRYHKNARIISLVAPSVDTINSFRTLLEDGEVIFNPNIENVKEGMAELAYSNGYGFECWYACNGENKDIVFDNIEKAVSLGVQVISLDTYKVEDAFIEKYNLIN